MMNTEPDITEKAGPEVKNRAENSGKNLVLGALCMALGLLLPMVFHLMGAGSEFLPMFFPILLAGFLVSLPLALMVGCMTPLISALLTGMPPLFPPVAWIMMAEGFVIAGLSWLLSRHSSLGMRTVVILVMAADRLVLLGAVLLVSRWLELPAHVLGIVSVVRGIPGVVVIILVMPALIAALRERLKKIEFPE